MKNYLCYRTAQIKKVADELNRRFLESNDDSIELKMKTGKIFLVGKRNSDYQVYYVGNITGDVDCNLVAECYSLDDLAICVMTL